MSSALRPTRTASITGPTAEPTSADVLLKAEVAAVVLVALEGIDLQLRQTPENRESLHRSVIFLRKSGSA
jgi:hypothetical protein